MLGKRSSGVFLVECFFVWNGMKLRDMAAERVAPFVRAAAVGAVVDIFSGEMHRLQVILNLNNKLLLKMLVTNKVYKCSHS